MLPKTDLNKKEVREAISHNSRGRGRSDAEKRDSFAKYQDNKKKVIELERKNLQYLILFPASDVDVNKKYRFYNMGGNSAIIYVHEIAPRLKRKAKMRRDMDPCSEKEKFHSGICSIANLEGLEAALLTIDVKRMSVKGEIVIFKLNREYSKDEIKNMLKLEQQRLDSLNELIYSKVLYPDVHKKIIDLKRSIPAKVKNMEKTYREVVGMEMIKSLMTLVKTYSQVAHGNDSPENGGNVMLAACDNLLAEVSMMNELRVWEVDACIRIASTIVELKRAIKGRLNKIQ
ncbi:hypothetical protein IKE13_02915 [Candidatus Saccharibacteria bacterium]|nr:hypothetical protein [Candidatus Saccharibacteria bacterium]